MKFVDCPACVIPMVQVPNVGNFKAWVCQCHARVFLPVGAETVLGYCGVCFADYETVKGECPKGHGPLSIRNLEAGLKEPFYVQVCEACGSEVCGVMEAGTLVYRCPCGSQRVVKEECPPGLDGEFFVP